MHWCWVKGSSTSRRDGNFSYSLICISPNTTAAFFTFVYSCRKCLACPSAATAGMSQDIVSSGHSGHVLSWKSLAEKESPDSPLGSNKAAKPHVKVTETWPPCSAGYPYAGLGMSHRFAASSIPVLYCPQVFCCQKWFTAAA